MPAFKLLVLFILVIGLTIFFIKLAKANKNNDKDSVQEIIFNLEMKIRLLEIKARQGIEGAQEELDKNKKDLEEIINLKEKLKN